VLRIAYLSVYAGCTAFGAAAVARPAVQWALGLRRSGFAAPPLGWLFAVLAVAIVGCAAAVAHAVAARRRASYAVHAMMLTLIAVAAALRTVVDGR
jgi:hypothetical protein